MYEIKNADLICFTDDPKNRNKYYKTYLRKPIHEDPNRSAKVYKILGDIELEKYDYTIWVDGHAGIKFQYAEEIVEGFLKQSKT